MFGPVLLFGGEVMVWREKERSWNRVVLMNNLRGVLTITRTDRVAKTRIRELCGGTKGSMRDLRTVLSNGCAILKRMGGYRIAKRVYVGIISWLSQLNETLMGRGDKVFL